MIGGDQGRKMGEGEPWLLLAMFDRTYYPISIRNLLIYSINTIGTKRDRLSWTVCTLIALGTIYNYISDMHSNR